jgi:hypothetical protein
MSLRWRARVLFLFPSLCIRVRRLRNREVEVGCRAQAHGRWRKMKYEPRFAPGKSLVAWNIGLSIILVYLLIWVS